MRFSSSDGRAARTRRRSPDWAHSRRATWPTAPRSGRAIAGADSTPTLGAVTRSGREVKTTRRSPRSASAYHAEGEDSEPGRPLADDRRVDRDRAWHWADYTVTLARGADRARPARARRRRARSGPGLDPDRAPKAARGGPGRRAGFSALGATPPRRPRGR